MREKQDKQWKQSPSPQHVRKRKKKKIEMYENEDQAMNECE